MSWLDAASKTSGAVVQQPNTAVAGELVGVDVQISNPMALGLSLTQLRAVYEHESGATGPVNEYLKVLSSTPLTCPLRPLLGPLLTPSQPSSPRPHSTPSPPPLLTPHWAPT